MSHKLLERNRKIVLAVKHGATLAIAGRAFGVSRQRVWSILQAHDNPPPKESKRGIRVDLEGTLKRAAKMGYPQV